MSPVTEDAVDVASALLEHVGHHGLAGVPHALDVHVDVEVARGVVHLLERGEAAHARVAAGDVDLAEGLDALRGGLVHLGSVGHVCHHGNHLGAVLLAELRGGLLHRGGQVDHDELCAVLGIGHGDSLAQAGGGAGDESDLTIQLSHLQPPFLRQLVGAYPSIVPLAHGCRRAPPKARPRGPVGSASERQGAAGNRARAAPAVRRLKSFTP